VVLLVRLTALEGSKYVDVVFHTTHVTEARRSRFICLAKLLRRVIHLKEGVSDGDGERALQLSEVELEAFGDVGEQFNN